MATGPNLGLRAPQGTYDAIALYLKPFQEWRDTKDISYTGEDFRYDFTPRILKMTAALLKAPIHADSAEGAMYVLHHMYQLHFQMIELENKLDDKSIEAVFDKCPFSKLGTQKDGSN